MDEFGVSLEQFVFNKINQIAGLEENLMQQLTSVVGFIHKKDIYSLNLNVFNVRVVFKNGRLLIKLLNFHNAQSLNGNKIRFSRTPGMLSDIYDLGCIFFFVLSKRHNLKEETTNLGSNMIVCILQSFENSNKTWKNVLCIDMIKRMMKPNENARPNINEIKSHPYFWEVDKIAKMIINVSKMFEDNNGSNQDFKMKLERTKKQVIGGNWKSKIDNEILEEICKHRMYDGQKLYQLVQAIRNILVHQTSPVIADNMGTTIEDILEYWLKKFPKLVVHLWQVAKDHNLL
ncbi:CLUMA_CG010816, isoform A [Clunio marinus]|uniref:CLUMA_CG010816, isoform A n=1 Tax=Clunio marinus TaxID=568069 RepID=A0A1J1IB41_9DIPT|nr:CLUMA_CG010816, isoform A [Clunio marinus]